MPILLRLIAGFAIGLIAWTVGVLRDGPDEAIFRIIFGGFVSVVFAGALFGIGYALSLIVPTSRFWWEYRPLLIFPVAVGAVILCVPDFLGLTHGEIDSESGESIQVYNSGWVMLLAYSLLIFPIVNWPKKRDSM